MVTEKSITFALAFKQRDLWPEGAKRKYETLKAADMAQLVEQRIRNAWVAGSSPAIGSLYIKESEHQGLTLFL